MEFFLGRSFHQGIEGKFNAESYQAFFGERVSPHDGTSLIQDGATEPTSTAMRQFFVQHSDRLTVFQLPLYSPDYNPIESLWRKTKKQATHNQYLAVH